MEVPSGNSKKRVRINHRDGKRAIDVRVIEVLLYFDISSFQEIYWHVFLWWNNENIYVDTAHI